MLDYTGHVKLVDFGLSKRVTNKQNLTHSFVGSDGYIAPEIKMGRGHNFLNDVYAVGVLIYELLHSKQPFTRVQRKARKHEQISQMHNEFHFKNDLSMEVRDLISRLICLSPEKRLDGEDDIMTMLSHPWFRASSSQINAQMGIIPFHIPDIISYHFDTSLLLSTDEMLCDIKCSI